MTYINRELSFKKNPPTVLAQAVRVAQLRRASPVGEGVRLVFG